MDSLVGEISEPEEDMSDTTSLGSEASLELDKVGKRTPASIQFQGCIFFIKTYLIPLISLPYLLYYYPEMIMVLIRTFHIPDNFVFFNLRT